MEEIKQKFYGLISTEFRIDLSEVSEDSRFIDDLKGDSLDIIEFMVLIEEEFDIKLGNEVLQHLITVNDAYEFLLKKLKDK